MRCVHVLVYIQSTLDPVSGASTRVLVRLPLIRVHH